MSKRLYRSRTKKMISGVCGGFSDYFNMNVTLVRIIAVVVTVILHGAGIIAYLAAILLMPNEPKSTYQSNDRMRKDIEAEESTTKE